MFADFCEKALEKRVMKTHLIFALMLFVLFAVWSQSGLACSLVDCELYPVVIGGGTVPSTLPALPIGASSCSVEDFFKPPTNGLGLNLETITMTRSGYSEPVKYTIEPSPHRYGIFYIKPEILYVGHTYIVSVKVPAQANEEEQTRSTRFKVTSAELPPKQLSLGVDVMSPWWTTETRRTNSERADCGSKSVDIYKRQIRGRVPDVLKPWANVLVWRVNIDGKWQNLSSNINGNTLVELKRYCSGPGSTDLWPEKTYMFEAFVPGTDLVWQSNTVSATLNCPMGKDEGHGGCAQASHPTANPAMLIFFGLLFGLRRRR